MPTLRQRLAKQLSQHSNDALRRFSKQLLPRGDTIPCWGAIAEAFDKALPTDADRLDLLRLLLAEQNPRPILLFVHLNKERPAVLNALRANFGNLPGQVQAVLVALTPEAIEAVPTKLAVLRRNARWRASTLEAFETRIDRLTSLKFWTPDPDPGGP